MNYGTIKLLKNAVQKYIMFDFIIVVPILPNDEIHLTVFLKKHSWVKKYNGIILVKSQGDLSISAKELILSHNYLFFEKKDSSLYDAWNQALDYLLNIKLNKNFYLTFLGLDDEINIEFISYNIKEIELCNYDFIYGNSISIFKNKKRVILSSSKPKLFSSGPFQYDIVNPGMLNRWSTIKEFKFNTNYSLAADLDFYIRISLFRDVNFLFTPLIQSIIGSDGISQTPKSNHTYKIEEEKISKELNVIIVSDKYRGLFLRALSSYPNFYRYFRNLYWSFLDLIRRIITYFKS
jgi:hypothetical protein